MTTIGIIGAGHIGSQIARAAVATGHSVVLSNSRGPETLTDLIAELGANAKAGTVQQAAEQGDVVVVTVPLAAISTIPVEPLAGKIVIDTNNYYFERDGHIAELDDETTTVSEVLQRHLPTSRVVKAFNNITFGDITDTATPAGTPNRRALAIAGDDAEAKQFTSALIEKFGFDVVDLGELAEGWRFQRDTRAYGLNADAAGLREALGAAVRKRDQ